MIVMTLYLSFKKILPTYNSNYYFMTEAVYTFVVSEEYKQYVLTVKVKLCTYNFVPENMYMHGDL